MESAQPSVTIHQDSSSCGLNSGEVSVKYFLYDWGVLPATTNLATNSNFDNSQLSIDRSYNLVSSKNNIAKKFRSPDLGWVWKTPFVVAIIWTSTSVFLHTNTKGWYVA